MDKLIDFITAFWPFFILAGLIGGVFALSARLKRHDVNSGGDYTGTHHSGDID